MELLSRQYHESKLTATMAIEQYLREKEISLIFMGKLL